MTTVKESKEFAHSLLGDMDDMLDSAVEWISNHMEPEDVFPEEALSRWATDSGFVKKESEA